MAELERVRVDVWLWAVRAFKTRSSSNEACRSGRVRVGDSPAKPATKVKIGDIVAVRLSGRHLEYRVEKIISKRVGATLAAACYEDMSPLPEVLSDSLTAVADPTSGRREQGSGRPTKRDRRRLDRLRRG